MGEGRTEGGDRPPAGQRYTVGEAAEALGVSVEAVRGRIKRGTIEHVREGGAVYVLLEPATTDRLSAGRDQPSDQSRLVEALEDQVGYLRNQLEAEREARRRADTIIAQLSRATEEQARAIRELEAAPQEADSPAESAGGVEDREPPSWPETETSQGSGEPGRPWWRRLFGR